MVNWMLDMIDHTGGRIGIGELSEKAGYTRRQMDRKFADFVGLHPELLRDLLKPLMIPRLACFTASMPLPSRLSHFLPQGKNRRPASCHWRYCCSLLDRRWFLDTYFLQADRHSLRQGHQLL